MKSILMGRSAAHPADFTLAVRVVPGDTFEWSKVLLAKAHFNGSFELLTSAWEKLLGYGRQEFAGKTLRQLMGPRKAAATAAIAAILDERDLVPVELSLCCRNGDGKCLTLHRRYDADERAMFIVAEERSLP